MAQEKLPFLYDLYQNANEDSTAYGKWYPRAVTLGSLNLRGLAKHITEHGSIYTLDVVYGVLQKFSSCMVELCMQGRRVKIDGLGTFYITLESKGADTPVKYNLDSYLQGAHLRFLPDDSEIDKKTSREMKKNISFEQHMIFDKSGKPKKVENDQLVDYGDQG